MSAAESTKLLDVQNLVTAFRFGDTWAHAVDDVSFHVEKGKTLGIVGESGCGKSVTSLSLMGLIPTPPGKIVSGKILYKGQNLLELSDSQMEPLRGTELSMIFQDPLTCLNPLYTVGEQIREVLRRHKGLSRRESWDQAIEMLRMVRIPSAERRAKEYPHMLSGGMRQRVMIAIALACRPQLLIADEPTTALDVTIQAQILALMNTLQEETGMGMVLITHDLGVVAETCDDVMVMYAGKAVEKTTARELFEKPSHFYTQGLLHAIPKLGQKSATLTSIPGMVPPLGQFLSGCRFADRCPRAADICRETEPAMRPLSPTHQAACHFAEELHQ